MRYYALATDYDGTIAKDGRVGNKTIESLKSFRDSGRKLILVTGRELDELMEVFPGIDLFDIVVAENGAILYNPATKEEISLAKPPLELFVYELKKRGVERISVGRVIVATWRPYEITVFETIRDLGLELQVIFNKDAVMILPTGINKASGLKEALLEIGLSPHNLIGIGDAENDFAFLSLCECSAVVDNALPMLKEQVDLIMKKSHGEGVYELIKKILETELSEIEPKLKRHEILLGYDNNNDEIRVKPFGESILIAGTSGGGKSTFALSFLDRLNENNYQYCIIDPEGDYENYENAVILGSNKNAPTVDEVMKLLEKPKDNCVVNVVGIPFENRPAFFASLLPSLSELRARTGRPHWIIIDETHHLLPASWAPAIMSVPKELAGLMLITIHPDHVAPALLSTVNLIIAVGDAPGKTISRLSETLKEKMPDVPDIDLKPGEVIAWWRHPAVDPFVFRSLKPKLEARRHRQKYAEGELSADRSFYFTGPEKKMKLMAQNLMIFLQISDGIDDETWLYHLKRKDYSKWFREMIKDENLAEEAEKVEGNENISPKESRKLIRQLVVERYTGSE